MRELELHGKNIVHQLYIVHVKTKSSGFLISSPAKNSGQVMFKAKEKAYTNTPDADAADAVYVPPAKPYQYKFAGG